jgi:ATP-dependent DNA helicase DinG
VPRTFVALDLETTGLSADRDAIIEIGMVKFRDGEPVEEYSTLIDPGRPIPYEIRQLTGISDADVAGQPRIAAVSGVISRFAGQLPIVAHNAGFDLGFMRNQALLVENAGLDTWELSSVMLPNQPSYSLGSLAKRFDIPCENHHRALNDADVAGRLFLALAELAMQLPRAVLMEISRLARNSNWALATVFTEALVASTGSIRPVGEDAAALDGLPLERLAPNSALTQPMRFAEPLVRNDEDEPIDVDELAAMLEAEGAVGQAFPGYEFRPPQVAMLRAVANAFNEEHHMLAEAGTGTGKSLAYLLPAIAYAVKNNTRVVISTNTINLQDQLYKKDLPDLQRILGAAWHKQTPFRCALLKGRSNYLCPRRFSALKAHAALSSDEMRGVARILIWLLSTETGDQGELSLPLPADRFVWSQVCADSEGCSLDRCQREQRGRCFFYRARKQADAAHVVIVNHALLLADAATENRVLPEYHHLIIDEAHHLEDAVTDQLSFKADSQLLNQLLGSICPVGGAYASTHSDGGSRASVYGGRGRSAPGGSRVGNPGLFAAPAGARSAMSLPKSGLLGDVLAVMHGDVPEELQIPIRNEIGRLQGEIEGVYARLTDFWSVVNDVVRDLSPAANNSDYDVRIRVTPSTRAQANWVEIEVSWDNVSAGWQSIIKRLNLVCGALEDIREGGFDPPGLEGLVDDLGSATRRLDELYVNLEAWCMKPDGNGIYWAEVNAQSGRIMLRAAPLHVGPLVREHILFRNDTVIMTSATLRTAGSFDYVRDRLQCYEADMVTVGSPFDYEHSTLLYLPADLPEPNAPGYQSAVEQTLAGLARALGGRTLALFTSYAQLRRTTQALTNALAGTGIQVLSQAGGTSRHQLLEVFKNSPNTVLLGTRSFWEGVDVVGPALSALVMVRLPFAVPSDPVVAARSETFEDAFTNYQVPDAILRFRQGFGRLIRSKADRGVVVVLDKRVQSKKYGQMFLDSLPECTVHKGPLMNLPSAAKAWVDGGIRD